RGPARDNAPRPRLGARARSKRVRHPPPRAAAPPPPRSSRTIPCFSRLDGPRRAPTPACHGQEPAAREAGAPPATHGPAASRAGASSPLTAPAIVATLSGWPRPHPHTPARGRSVSTWGGTFVCVSAEPNRLKNGPY